MESVVPGPGTRRNARGRIACTVCHRRKDGEECTLRVSNRGKHKRSRKGDELESTGSSPRYTAVTTNIAVAADVQQPVTSARNGNDALSISAIISKTPPQLTAPALESAHLPSVEEDQGEHVEWARYNARPVEHESHLVPFHCEDFIHSWGLTVDEGNGSTKQRGPHLWVPQRSQKPFGDAELKYLEAKGALSLPSNELCEKLLDAYFTFVHPLLPVVEMTSFWERYELQQPGNVSPLLLQSMFLAASTYLPSDLYKANGFPSAIALKEVFFNRAKILFDVGIEQNKIVLAQSALLMSYWYGNADNIAVCWHWTGIASSLCQEMGLHRNPIDSRVPEPRRSLWRRVWWCCVHRDRWIALGLGRPMRISGKDCDVKTLTISDLAEEPGPCSGLSNRALTSIETYRSKTHLFVQTVNLSVCLGDVIAYHFTLDQSTGLTAEQSAECEWKLATWYIGLDPGLVIDLSYNVVEESNPWTLQKHILNIFYHVVTVTLHRLRLSDRFVGTSGNQEHLQTTREKCWAAASAATNSLRLLIDLNLISVLPPEIPTALNVIISVLFTQRAWITGLQQKAVVQKLDLCMMVMAEIGDTHWAARSSLAYFMFALEKSGHESTNRDPPQVIAPDPAQTVLTPANSGLDVNFLTGIDDFPSPSRWLYDFGVNDTEDFSRAYAGFNGV